jgi:hypothetical protein
MFKKKGVLLGAPFLIMHAHPSSFRIVDKILSPPSDCDQNEKSVTIWK